MELALFALNASRQFGHGISAAIGVPLSDHEERSFEDGEHKARPLVNVRGRDVYVIQSLHGDNEQSVNDKLCMLLFFLGALKDASAGRVTAVIPYLCYARKDRKTKSRDPVTTRYVAAVLESVGTDRVVTLDVHNLAAFQNAFRCETVHLEARMLFVDHFVRLLTDLNVAVVSPDAGGVKRAEHFREALARKLERDVPLAFMEKKRSEGIVSGEAVVGDIRGKTAIIIDDLISTGTTMVRTAAACRALGAKHVYAVASHGLFVGDADRIFSGDAFEKTIITNSVPPFRLAADTVRERFAVLDATALFAEAIKRIHTTGSIVELLDL